MFEYLQFSNIVFFGTSVDVKIWLEDDKVHYTKRLWKPGYNNESDVSSMSVEEVSEKIENLRINKWHKRYQHEDRFICDGEEWFVKYKDSSRKRTKVIEGDNAYPENWKEFLIVLTEVVGDVSVEDDEE